MPINLAFIGTGKAFDDVHFPILLKLKGYRVSGIFDIDRKRARSAAERAGCSAFPSYGRMLESDKIDIVVVTTPSNTHAKYAIQALNSGKHVIVDKPPAITLADVKKMFAAAKRNNRMLITFLNRRWDGDYVTVKRILAKRRIGEVFHIETSVLDTSYGKYGVFKKWRQTRKYGGGQLLDWGPHVIDQVLQMVQSPVQTVWADLRSLKWSTEVDDHCMLVLRFKNHAVARIMLSGNICHPGHRWFVCGMRGVIWQNGWDDPIYVRTVAGMRTREAAVPIAKTDWGMFYKLLEKAMKGRRELPVKPEDAIHLLMIIEAAGKSARTAQAVRIRNW